MALTFPLSASIGQTYQSGSSNTYEWTGAYWKIKNVINFNAFSASIVNRIDNISVSGGNVDSSSLVTTSSFNSYTASVQTLSASFDLRILQATNEQNISNLATTGSNVFKGTQTISGSVLLSGSLVPSVGNGTFTSSFSLGSPTNAWKDLYISQGSIIFVNAVTQATSSFSIDNEGGTDNVKYTSAITASSFIGDGSRLTNLPATTNWNKDKEYILTNTEQLTFAGDYILENALLVIEGSATASVDGIDEWVPVIFTEGNGGTITKNSNNGYLITGPTGDSNASDGVQIKRLFDTNTTMSISYVWNGTDVGVDRPYYEVGPYDPTEPTTTSALQDTNAVSESGNWTINVPSGSWLAIGVWTDGIDATSGSLQLTFPYTDTADIEQYSTNKYFKKQGSLFIGGNLLVKDSTIINNGKISVGGEVILMGNSQIEGTGTII